MRLTALGEKASWQLLQWREPALSHSGSSARPLLASVIGRAAHHRTSIPGTVGLVLWPLGL